jgi:hypothetical protein
LNTPPEEILRRRKRNEETQERGQLEEVTLQDAFDMFEEPTEGENPLVYNGLVPLEGWIGEHIHL